MLDNSPDFTMIELDEVSSTNTFLRDYRPIAATAITLVTAEHQTAGRGQTGNTWESARGANLLFSLQVRPKALPAAHSFALSQAIALAIREALLPHLTSVDALTVKWPNDIYVDDRKIAGILIENDFCGTRIERSIIGCGVNINQTVFTFLTAQPSVLNLNVNPNLSQAPTAPPTPVSLCQLTGQTFERSLVLSAIVDTFRRSYSSIESADAAALEALRSEYLTALYRHEGLHPYRDAQGPFTAEIADVEPTGRLILRDSEGHLRHYSFKEVAYLKE